MYSGYAKSSRRGPLVLGASPLYTPPPERPPSGTWADPERPPPPPPVDEPIGLLDVPAGVDGAQLTLHPPVTGALVRIEQRLVPADRPLRADLRYRLRPVRAEPLQD